MEQAEASPIIFEDARLEPDETAIGEIQQLSNIFQAPEDLWVTLTPSLTADASISTQALYECHRKKKFEEAYRVLRDTRGRCLIISNRRFKNTKLHPRRLGTDADRDRLKRLFTNLGYEVKVENDLKAEEIYSTCSQYADVDATRCDSFVLCILSHGNEDCIIGSDSKKIKEKEIFDLLSDGNRSLAGKPKLVIIQACRTAINKRLLPKFCLGGGNTTDSAAGSASLSKGETDQQLIQLLHQLNSMDKIEIQKAVPDSSDLLIAYSTMLGQQSFRNEAQGSWFIQTLVRVFEMHSQREHVADMLVTVKRIFHQAFGNNQAPHTVNYLVKKFYFFEE